MCLVYILTLLFAWFCSLCWLVVMCDCLVAYYLLYFDSLNVRCLLWCWFLRRVFDLGYVVCLLLADFLRYLILFVCLIVFCITWFLFVFVVLLPLWMFLGWVCVWIRVCGAWFDMGCLCRDCLLLRVFNLLNLFMLMLLCLFADYFVRLEVGLFSCLLSCYVRLDFCLLPLWLLLVCWLFGCGLLWVCALLI